MNNNREKSFNGNKDFGVITPVDEGKIPQAESSQISRSDCNAAPNQSKTQKDNSIRIALIDSRSLTRLSISHLLTTLSGDFVISSYRDIDEFVADSLECPNQVKTIVVNLGTARVRENHISNEILRLKREFPNSPLALLSDRDELDDILDALRIGVRGYITSVFNPLTVIQSLRLVMAGGTFIPHSALLEIANKVATLMEEERLNGANIDSAVLRTFTPRQIEVLNLVRQGESNKSIAYELGMQECTVKVHVREIMTKLKATNRTHAAFLASQIIEEKVEY